MSHRRLDAIAQATAAPRIIEKEHIEEAGRIENSKTVKFVNT